jgi:ribonuclease D
MHLVTTEGALSLLLPSLAATRRLAFDLEANGRFAYRARVCMIQLAWDEQTAIVDALATSLSPLASVLGPAGPIKIVHDVAFDARMLAEVGIHLGNVHDTALTAQLLGRPATGLASLALSDLGVTLDKSLQSYDWARRPLDPKMLAYLETDVLHLAALDDKLWALAGGTPATPATPTTPEHAATPSIETEILEETRYRIASAITGGTGHDPRPLYARVKGVDKLKPAELPLLRRLAEARDRAAARLDVPANELVGNAALLDLARAAPRDIEAFKRVRGAMPRHQGYAVARELIVAIDAGLADGSVPPEDLGWIDKPRLAPDQVRLRRGRETRLLAWRKATAAARHVNEQVVLPGHCLKDATEIDPPDRDRLSQVPGIGSFRIERDGDAILAALASAAPATSSALTSEPIPE